jgi:2-isopropylmalate synthase
VVALLHPTPQYDGSRRFDATSNSCRRNSLGGDFGKSWDLHVTEGLKISLEENLAMIQDTIEYLRSSGRRVIYDAEHWFDGYKHKPDYALKTLEVAIAAGAEWLVLCDTNGGTLPHEISATVRDVVRAIPQTVHLGIHTHNDSDTAVANALAAVIEGARMVQGTINGYGERCGNANLCSLIPNLQLKLGYTCLQNNQLNQLTAASRFVSEVVNLAPDEHAAFVGRSAFAHKGGIHVSAVERNPVTYEHIQPEQVGNQRRIVISEQAGLSNVLAKPAILALNSTSTTQLPAKSYNALRIWKVRGINLRQLKPVLIYCCAKGWENGSSYFRLKAFKSIVTGQGVESNNSNALATVKLTVNSQDILEAAEGNGPVAALDAALRKALVNFIHKLRSLS